MKKRGVIRFALISIIIFIVAVLISIAAKSVLLWDAQVLHFSNDKASLIASMIDGAVGAIAAGFVLYELKNNENTQVHENDIEEAQFMLQYNQAFIQDDNMSEVESELEKWMEKRSTVPLINDQNRQKYVNYLVYLEGMSPLILRKIVKLEHVDDLMAYRFFLALNNPDLQKDQLFRYPEYFRGCFKVYTVWKQYREQNGLPILMPEYSLDLWKEYKYYSSNITVRKSLLIDDLETIAKLIFETDPYIYPAAFGNKQNALRELPELINSKGIFQRENIYVAIVDGNICGIAVVVNNQDDAFIPINNRLIATPSFQDVNDKYFSNIRSIIQQGQIYIACICVKKKARRNRIGDLLLSRIIKEYHNSSLVLEVLKKNEPAIKLYQKNGFAIIREEAGYSQKENKPRCFLMERKPDKNDD